MIKHELVIGTICFFCTSILFFPFVSKANDEEGFFFNQQLQNFISSSVEISHKSVNAKLNVADVATWQPALKTKDGYSSEIENIYHCDELVQNVSLCDIASPLKKSNHPKKGAVVSIQNEKISIILADLSDDVATQPQNGRFQMSEDEKLLVVEKSKPGLELDVEKTTAEIVQALNSNDTKSVSLSFNEIQPEISTENIEALGINEQIGHGESNFRGSPRNRIHNIKVATSKFDGFILGPKEEFSFTSLLGPVDGETGYKKELVIKENKTIPEFGGGVCQVSTTMFRAALNTGFEITERRNHAYPVQYYSPQGTDATIYLPRPDLKFVNNSPQHILIQSSIEGTILSFDIFGTSDKRDVELDGPYVTERTPDGRMKTVLYQNVKGPDGTYIVKDVFKSFYDNPDKYHEPEFKQKPEDWSNRQWDEYKAKHGL